MLVLVLSLVVVPLTPTVDEVEGAVAEASEDADKDEEVGD